jgi:hypothetical protein
MNKTAKFYKHAIKNTKNWGFSPEIITLHIFTHAHKILLSRFSRHNVTAFSPASCYTHLTESRGCSYEKNSIRCYSHAAPCSPARSGLG